MEKPLHNALLAVQKELPMIKRDTQAFNYKYAPLDVIWEKVGAILNKHGFLITNEITHEGILTRAIHESGELTSFFAFSGALKPQERGSEITYGRRYNLTAIFNIQLEDEDDDGKSANDKAVPVARQTTGGLGNCDYCGAPKKMSQKTGKAYCSALCWTKPKQGRPMDEVEQAFSNSLKDIPTVSIDDIR
jgi:hypothetical protein